MANISNGAGNTVITGTANSDTIKNAGDRVTIQSGNGNDIISSSNGMASASSVSIDAGLGNDSIYNVGWYDTVYAGGGNDTIDDYSARSFINGGSGDDRISLKTSDGGNTVIGGTGNDTVYLSSITAIGMGNIYQYTYGDGNDVIYNIQGLDSISISGSAYSTTTSGSDLIIKVGEGAMTLVGAADTAVNIVGEYGENLPAGLSLSGDILSIGTAYADNSLRASDYDVTKVDATALSRGLKIYGSTNAECIAGGSGNDTVYGSNGADTIFGNAGNDCLNGGNGADILYGGEGADKLNGGNGDDTLYGGAGNDTLTGGNGRDVFFYESGNDLITDYRAGYDKIKLASGTISRSSISGTNVILTTDSGTLTVRGGRGKNITVIDASGNETTQKYSNAVYGSSALLADDNFISDEMNLDAITESKSVVTSFENFAQEQIQIPYSSITSSAKSTNA
ncbi:MAG: calcium-binding protein [Selenomonadaceae bacterium]|nr:calcium-binding protein [Selenomonadaceae bacterium]